MNDPIHAYLTKLGLTPTETSVYLSGLSYTEVDVRTLVRETGVKRPTLYHALETLMQKGMASKRGTARRLVFSMVAPDRLEQLVERRMQELTSQKKMLSDIIPLIRERVGRAAEQTIQVSQFDGIEGIKTVVEEALYCKSRHWDIIAPRKNFFSDFDPEYARYYLDTRNARGLTARTLWERDALEIGRPLSADEIAQRNPRYLPQRLHGRFESVMMLFDDKVALIGSLSSLSAVLIHSKEVHRFMSVMFDGLWEISEEYGAPVDSEKRMKGKTRT